MSDRSRVIASGLATSAALSRIRLRHLSCFVVVAQERTLARAADRLHLSQPAVSKTLTELERLAGHQLVERSRAGTQLTAAGEQFLRYAVDVTRALDSAAAALTEAEPPRYPTVRVAALPTAAGGLLAQAIARLRETPAARGGAGADRAQPGADGGAAGGRGRLRGRPDRGARDDGGRLVRAALRRVARRRHPSAAPAGGRWRRPAARSRCSRCSATPWSSPASALPPGTTSRGSSRRRAIALPPGRTETQSVSVARALTLLSDTVWITPQHAVQLDLDRGWLRKLNVPMPGSAEPVGILSSSGTTPGELAKQLMETLRELA